MKSTELREQSRAEPAQAPPQQKARDGGGASRCGGGDKLRYMVLGEYLGASLACLTRSPVHKLPARDYSSIHANAPSLAPHDRHPLALHNPPSLQRSRDTIIHICPNPCPSSALVNKRNSGTEITADSAARLPITWPSE